MSQNLVTTSCAIAKCQPMPPSAMEPINSFLGGLINIIEDFGVCGEWPHSGLVLDTGCLPSTNERRARALAELSYLNYLTLSKN